MENWAEISAIVTEESKKQAAKLYKKAKKHGEDEEFVKARDCLREAVKWDPHNEKYKRRLAEVEDYLAQSSTENPDDFEEDDESMQELNERKSKVTLLKDASMSKVKREPSTSKVKREQNDEELPDQVEQAVVPKQKQSTYVDVVGHRVLHKSHEKLYDYQKIGLEIMLKLFNEGSEGNDQYAKGFILADDMGLGKTVQVVVLLSTLMLTEKIKCVLIVAPTSLLTNWHKEFNTWYGKKIRVEHFHEGSKNRRLNTLESIQRYGGVLMTTYDMARNYEEHMNRYKGRVFTWDYLVLDEAHKIKNPTKTTKSLHNYNAHFRIAVTGTPVQNNLKEFWTIFNFVNGVFGPYSVFKNEYETDILKARERGARSYAIERGNRKAENLRQRYAKYFLRRTKEEVLKNDPILASKLTTKYDWVVWIPLSQLQVGFYRDVLDSKDVRDVIRAGKKNCMLVQLTFLKRLCDHPRMLPVDLCRQIFAKRKHRAINDNIIDENGKVDLTKIPLDQLYEESSKLIFLVELLKNLKEENHKTIIFSQSTFMLDIIQLILKDRGFKMLRLDGQIRKMAERDKIIYTSQNDDEYKIILVTTQVGGVGLTLTAADRVVIYDPSWNPATDSQAIDRAYRIGQTKDVIVYRLVTCGTVEEKIFRRQVAKTALHNQMVESDEDPTRYFKADELTQLFEFKQETKSETFHLIEELHGTMKMCEKTDAHRGFISNLEQVYGVSDHDFLYSTNDEVIEINDEERADIKRATETAAKHLTVGANHMNNNASTSRPFDARIVVKDDRVYESTYKPVEKPTVDSDVFQKSQEQQQQNESVILDEVEEENDSVQDIMYKSMLGNEGSFVELDHSYGSRSDNSCRSVNMSKKRASKQNADDSITILDSTGDSIDLLSSINSSRNKSQRPSVSIVQEKEGSTFDCSVETPHNSRQVDNDVDLDDDDQMDDFVDNEAHDSDAASLNDLQGNDGGEFDIIEPSIRTSRQLASQFLDDEAECDSDEPNEDRLSEKQSDEEEANDNNSASESEVATDKEDSDEEDSDDEDEENDETASDELSQTSLNQTQQATKDLDRTNTRKNHSLFEISNLNYSFDCSENVDDRSFSPDDEQGSTLEPSKENSSLQINQTFKTLPRKSNLFDATLAYPDETTDEINQEEETGFVSQQANDTPVSDNYNEMLLTSFKDLSLRIARNPEKTKKESESFLKYTKGVPNKTSKVERSLSPNDFGLDEDSLISNGSTNSAEVNPASLDPSIY